MGNQPTTIEAQATKPQQFVSQAHSDWVKQVNNLYSQRPTLTKTLILPPGVDLSDARLKEGVVVAERTYTIPAGQFPEWPENTPFECDIDGRLLPPCWGQEQIHAHYAVYPNSYFPELNCEYCALHAKMHPALDITTPGFVEDASSEEPTTRIGDTAGGIPEPLKPTEEKKEPRLLGLPDTGEAEGQHRQVTGETRVPLDDESPDVSQHVSPALGPIEEEGVQKQTPDL